MAPPLPSLSKVFRSSSLAPPLGQPGPDISSTRQENNLPACGQGCRPVQSKDNAQSERLLGCTTDHLSVKHDFDSYGSFTIIRSSSPGLLTV